MPAVVAGGPNRAQPAPKSPPDSVLELVEVVVVGPVVLLQQLPARGVDGRAPEVLVHRVVDGDMPREPYRFAGRLVAQPYRDRPRRDPAI
jgi:hypothetical protein